MWFAAIVALLAQAVPAAAFLVVAPRSNYQTPFAKTKAVPIFKEDHVGPTSTTFLTMASLVLASALVTASLKSKKAQSSPITMYYGDRRQWKTYPAYPQFRGQIRNEFEGPEQKRLTRLVLSFDKNPRFMLRFQRQNKALAKAGLTRYTTGWEEWSREKEEWKAYTGPESHPDNPFFPAPSHGFFLWGGALPNAKRGASIGSSSPATASFAFAGSSAMPGFGATRGGAVRSAGRSGRSAIIMHAHKKAAASTKNQGSSQNPKRKGRCINALQGAAVKTSTRLVRQSTLKWDNGAHVARTRQYMLKSKKDGIVQYFGSGRNLEVAVMPWEYVRKKCVWVDSMTLGPKVYEPWMGNKVTGAATITVRKHIMNLRETWLQTEEGLAWQAKKSAQQAKRNEYAEKSRARGTRWKWLRSEQGQVLTAQRKAERQEKVSIPKDPQS